jgi:hypothetical protein
MKMVNGRAIPEIVGELHSQEGINKLSALLTEFANAMSETVDGDTLALTALGCTGLSTLSGGITASGAIGLTGSKASVWTIGSNSSAAGSGFALTASATACLKVYCDDAGTLYGEAAVRNAVFRNLITVSHSNETSIFGGQGQLKIKPVDSVTLTTGNRAGWWNYLEMAGTTGKTITLSGANKVTAGSFAMVDWDGTGALTLSSGHVLAGFAALTNVTKTGGTFTQTGMFAGFALVNNTTASYSEFNAGVFFGAKSVVVPFAFTDESDVASVTNGAILADISATANAGYIKVLVGTTARYIPLYALKAS